jgi:lyso-ornithine lipid O-acyltransferase
VTTWRPEVEPPPVRIPPLGWVLVPPRAVALATVTYGGLLVLLLVRLIEHPLAGRDRPVSPFLTQVVCRAALAILGIGYRVEGRPMTGQGAVVANHSSWLDIFALNACQRAYFVSKDEVAGWPGIGWLARATGTVFIRRDPKHARHQQDLFETRIRAGHKLLFFPEGTSTDGRRVLPFKSTLFAAFYTHGLEHVMQIQPVSVIYHAPAGADPRFYGWWGDMDFARHLLKVLATPRPGRVEVVFHPPVAVDAFASRKDLAAHCERAVRQGFAAHLSRAAE